MPGTLPSSRELRDRCESLAADLIGLQAIPEERRPDTHRAELRGVIDRLQDANALFDSVRRIEQHDIEAAAWERAAATPEARGSRGPSAAFSADSDTRSAGEMFTASDQYRPGEYRTSEVEVRNLLTSGDHGSGANLFVPVGSPTWNSAAARRRRTFLRDLIPASQTNLTSIPYIREFSAFAYEGGASAVAEASAKPEVTMQWERDDAPVRKLAAWIQVTEEAYNDAPTLRGYIDTRLAYMLAVREEDQLLNGSGTSPNIKGIYQFTGLQTQAAVTGDLAGTIGLSIAKIENVDGFPTAVVINPITYWTGTVTRHSTWMDGGFGGSSQGVPFDGPPDGLWGLPAVRTRAMATDKALVGDFQIGAQIFDRQGTTLKSTDSHASLFVSNTLVILAEKRLALAVHRPDYFVDTTLAWS